MLNSYLLTEFAGTFDAFCIYLGKYNGVEHFLTFLWVSHKFYSIGLICQDHKFAL